MISASDWNCSQSTVSSWDSPHSQGLQTSCIYTAPLSYFSPVYPLPFLRFLAWPLGFPPKSGWTHFWTHNSYILCIGKTTITWTMLRCTVSESQTLLEHGLMVSELLQSWAQGNESQGASSLGAPCQMKCWQLCSLCTFEPVMGGLLLISEMYLNYLSSCPCIIWFLLMTAVFSGVIFSLMLLFSLRTISLLSTVLNVVPFDAKRFQVFLLCFLTLIFAVILPKSS